MASTSPGGGVDIARRRELNVGVVRKLVRQHSSYTVAIPAGVLALWRAPEHQGQVELVLRQVPGVPDHVELDVRWLQPPAPKEGEHG